ncbi:hypothetical protein ACJW8F_13240 [Plesiomonas shigelloides]|uniref:hypothetical protein n=1 Tax=Plesiomonas shigelloides TaxID=703 RepID=UPI00387EED9E
MFEKNFIAFIKAFSKVPVYSFYIPDGAPSKAFCFENAGSGTDTNYFDGSQVRARTVKLTMSSTNIEDVFDDYELNKYIRNAHQMGEMKILCARVMNFSDNMNPEQKIFERTYTIQVKYKEQ